MRHEITERREEVEMRVTGAGDRAPHLLAAMQDCRAGRCGCPTDQYQRLAGMDVEADDDSVTVTLRPLPGQQLDIEALGECLDYTVTQAENQSTQPRE